MYEKLLSVTQSLASREIGVAYTVGPGGNRVSLSLYDRVGTLREKLFDGVQERGIHKLSFDVSRLQSGIYFLVLDSGGKRFSRKITLIH